MEGGAGEVMVDKREWRVRVETEGVVGEGEAARERERERVG